MCKGIEQDHSNFSEINQESNQALMNITNKWKAANIFLYYGLMHQIDKTLLLEEYEAILTDVNGLLLLA